MLEVVDDRDSRASRLRLSVAISTFKRPAGLARLLAALRPQVEGRPGREIVVVNDGSHDTAYENVARSCANVISYHALPENAGVARARNESAARASGAYLVFTDDDCEPPPFWLDWLEARLDANPELDVVIGTTLPLYSQQPRFFERVNGHYELLPQPRGTPAAPLFATANVAIRRALLERVGGFGFRDAFTGAGEDTELASRLIAGGARTVVDYDWFVRHDVCDGLTVQMRRYWRYGYANVWMRRFTSSPSSNEDSARAHRKALPENALRLLRRQLALSDGFSPSKAMRWISAAAASLVLIAYYDGCAKAAADRRRELRI